MFIFTPEKWPTSRSFLPIIGWSKSASILYSYFFMRDRNNAIGLKASKPQMYEFGEVGAVEERGEMER